LDAFNKQYDKLPIDMISRLIRQLPPVEAHDAKSLDVSVQTIKLTSGNGGSYLVQLPPGYSHQRAYPVMMVCHSGRESAEDTLKRLSDEAAKQGVILVAPLWSGGKKGVKAKVAIGA